MFKCFSEPIVFDYTYGYIWIHPSDINVNNNFKNNILQHCQCYFNNSQNSRQP